MQRRWTHLLGKARPAGGRRPRRPHRRLQAEALERRALLAANQFAVIGDFGDDDNPAELAVANLVKSWDPAFIITTGDNNYASGKAETIDANIGKYYQEFIGNYQGSYGPGSLTNRFFPSLGNHDWHTPGAQPYLDYFTLPGNERYYDFVAGPIHFFALDADDSEPDGWTRDSVQAQWLKAGLEASAAPFQVVYFHQPPFSSGEHGNTAPMQWPFELWGADAVFTGHDHDYERLVIDDFPYFVSGAGGRSLRPFQTVVPGSEVRYADDYGAMLVTFSESELVAEFYSIAGGGTLIDHYTISARPKSDPVTLSFQDGMGDYRGTRDTRMRSNYPTLNYGTAKTLGVDGSPDAAALLRWDLSEIPPGSTVHSASIAVNVTDGSVDGYELYALERDWIEAEASWNQASLVESWAAPGVQGPGDRGTAVLATLSTTELGIYQAPLTAEGVAAVQAWIDNPPSNFGLVVQDYESARDGLTINSSEVAVVAQRPRLSVTFTPPAVAPNEPPTVDAGPDAQVSVGLAAALDGTAVDDGRPASPGAVTTLWTKVSGPGEVSFGDAAAVDTSLSVSLPGSYLLRLTADDGQLQSADDVAVTFDGWSPPVVLIQAEDFQARNGDTDHAWWIVGSESPGVGAPSGATAPYLQSLTDAGLDSGKLNQQPAPPYVEYHVTVAPAGLYAVDLLLAGLGSSSDSAWVQVPTGSLADAEGLPVASPESLIVSTTAGRFTWRNAGQWNLAAGEHTIRVSMRESGTALDALRIERLAESLAALGQAAPTALQTVGAAGMQRAMRRVHGTTTVATPRASGAPTASYVATPATTLGRRLLSSRSPVLRPDAVAAALSESGLRWD